MSFSDTFNFLGGAISVHLELNIDGGTVGDKPDPHTAAVDVRLVHDVLCVGEI